MRHIFNFVLILLVLQEKAKDCFAFQILSRKKSSIFRRNLFGIFGGGKRIKNPNNLKDPDDQSRKFSGGNVRAPSKPKEGSIGETAYMIESFKKAQFVGKRTEVISQDLAKLKCEGSSENGKVKVIFDGQQNPIGVTIDDSFLLNVSNVDLASAFTEAMQDAHSKSRQVMKDKVQSLYSDLGLPTI